MNIHKILQSIEYEGNVKDIDIDFVTDDSRKIKDGCIFVCSKGFNFDGHSYANKALEQGAKLLVCEYDTGQENQIIVKDSRKAYAQMCANLFDNPAKKLKMIGITGTNGKTTTSFLIKDLLEQLGKKVGLIGTVHNMIDTQIIPAKFTTPKAYELNALLSQMHKSGCEYAVMEVSSQGLVQDRLYSIEFDVGIFLNLTLDHLDYHKTMENYFKAKCMLMDTSKKIITNIDDDYGKMVAEIYKDKNLSSISTKNDEANYTAKDIKYTQNSTKFVLVTENKLERIDFPMPGEYSVHNAMTAAVTCLNLGFSFEDVAKSIPRVKSVKGRCEILAKEPFTVIRDFAHTADGLENVLKSLKPFVEGKFYVLFGCAGDRDSTKRRPMAQTVAKYADFIIVASDNPRSEDPQKVLDDTCSYFIENDIDFLSEVDRRKAINIALSMLQYKDMLILCGKGHEDYQVLDGITVYLDESMIVKKFMENYNK